MAIEWCQVCGSSVWSGQPCGKCAHDGIVATRDAEIARLKAEVEKLRVTADEAIVEHLVARKEVERLRVDHERSIETLTVSGIALDVHSTMSMTTHVKSIVSQVRDLLRENQAQQLDLAAHKRALAAGPAALRAVALQARAAGETILADGALDCAANVEAAQEAAMKEWK